MEKKETKGSVKERLETSLINLDECVKDYSSILKSEKKSRHLETLKKSINAGENYIRQTQRTEVKKFDDSVIKEVEEGLEAIERIISNPRSFIKEQAELVQVGLAKRVSTISIRHFATHSQFVRNINEKNEVIPEKVLTIYAETDMAIYENRFVMTLIRRCLSFLQMRFNYIIEHGETRDSDLLLIHNKTEIGNVTYEVDSRIKISTPSEDDGNLEKNQFLLSKLTELKNRCSTYLGSAFMSAMKGAKEVTSPIHMTNMIVKQPDYHKCYLFWNFLDEYEELGVNYDVHEVNQEFSDEYLEEINSHIASSIALLHSNRVDDSKIETVIEKKYTPEVIFTLEDQTYQDGRFLYDAYPDAINKPNPLLPLTSEEVRKIEEDLIQKLKNEKDAKKVVTKNINKDKDQVLYQETQERKKKIDEVLMAIDALLEENKALKQELEALKKK